MANVFYSIGFVINEARIKIMMTLFKGHLRRNKETRKGECKRCGKCCGNCIWFNKKSCLIYNHWKDEPGYCLIGRAFPLDRTDRFFVNRNCGYYWGKKKR